MAGILSYRRAVVEVRVRVEDTAGNELVELATTAGQTDDGTVTGLHEAVSSALQNASEELEGLVDAYGRIRKRRGDA